MCFWTKHNKKSWNLLLKQENLLQMLLGSEGEAQSSLLDTDINRRVGGHSGEVARFCLPFGLKGQVYSPCFARHSTFWQFPELSCESSGERWGAEREPHSARGCGSLVASTLTTHSWALKSQDVFSEHTAVSVAIGLPWKGRAFTAAKWAKKQTVATWLFICSSLAPHAHGF